MFPFKSCCFNKNKDYDNKREQALQEHNLHVIRFSNEEILNNLPDVLKKIQAFCGDEVS